MSLPFLKRVRYRLEWLLLYCLFGLLRRLPLKHASNFGAWLARSIGPRLKVTRTAKRNLQQAFPDWDTKQVTQTIHAMWDNLGRYGGEFPHIAKLSRDEFFAITEVEGAEHLIQTQIQDGGTLLFSCHMANWELGAKTAWELDAPVSVVYRPLNNPLVDRLVNLHRDHYQISGISKTGAGGRVLLKTLKNGGRIALLNDQKMNSGIPVPFFGRDAMTARSIADLSVKYGYPILPARLERIGHAPKFRVQVYPPLQYEKTGDQEADVKTILTSMNQLMETWIRERPEQWFWVHKRWG